MFTGDGPDNIVLTPQLRHIKQGVITNLDRLDNSVINPGEWISVEIGIGRQKEEFNIGFKLEYHGEGYKAGKKNTMQVGLSCSLYLSLSCTISLSFSRSLFISER